MNNFQPFTLTIIILEILANSWLIVDRQVSLVSSYIYPLLRLVIINYIMIRNHRQCLDVN